MCIPLLSLVAVLVAGVDIHARELRVTPGLLIETVSAVGLDKGRFQKAEWQLWPELEVEFSHHLRAQARLRLRADRFDRLDPENRQPERSFHSRRATFGNPGRLH